MDNQIPIQALIRAACATLAAMLMPGCDSAPDTHSVSVAANRFPDISETVGLNFIHDAGIDGSYSMPESIGAGVALFDYDGDGDLDIYLVDGGPLNGKAGNSGMNRLYSQENDGRFVDRTLDAGLGDAGYGMGVALGDIDNDGDLDVFVSNYGPDAMYRNDGEGRFSNITGPAGIDADDWSTSACFLDYDLDGLLDLYVTAYVNDRPARACTDSSGRREYCGPKTYRGAVDRLWRNQGAGRFIDTGLASSTGGESNKGLGVVSADFNLDGWPDIFVANDGEKNNLWINNDTHRFEDQALMMGVAYNSFGKPEASMGVALGDVNGDRQLDLYVTHLVRETNTLYTGADGGMQDSTGLTGSGAESMPYTGFGTAFLDIDNDGDLDLAVANGRVTRNEVEVVGVSSQDEDRRFIAEYGEQNLLYLNDGTGHLENICDRAGDLCREANVSRGLATGDMDGDGDLDVIINNDNGPARLFRNDLPAKGNWLTVRAIDPALNRDAIGATIEVRAEGLHVIRPVTHCYSYLSSSEAEVHFGLGKADRTDAISITWPGGSTELFPGVPANRSITLKRGEGVPAS